MVCGVLRMTLFSSSSFFFFFFLHHELFLRNDNYTIFMKECHVMAFALFPITAMRKFNTKHVHLRLFMDRRLKICTIDSKTPVIVKTKTY